MTILAQFKNKQVEVLDVYETGGRKFATVKALEGRPFVGGNKWPVFTEWATAPADELAFIRTDPQPEPTRPNLLTMALAYQDKAQWISGEVVNLVESKTGRPLAWLRNDGNGRVLLLAEGVKKALTVYLLDVNGWELVPTVGADYHQWAQAAQANR